MQRNQVTAALSRPLLTEAALCAWIGNARPGERLIYHRGFLAIDAGPDSKALGPRQRQELRRVAARAWQLAEDGIVHLVQRRESDGEYVYFVVARPRPRLAGGALQVVREQAGLSAPDLDVRRSA